MFKGEFVDYTYGDGSEHLAVVTSVNDDGTCNIFVFDSVSVVVNANNFDNLVAADEKAKHQFSFSKLQ